MFFFLRSEHLTENKTLSLNRVDALAKIKSSQQIFIAPFLSALALPPLSAIFAGTISNNFS